MIKNLHIFTSTEKDHALENGLIPPHICVCPKAGPPFSMPYHGLF
jgi:hypothetical protein